MNQPVLKIKNLKIDLKSGTDFVRIIDSVNLELNEMSTHGLVGESGCGKTITALSILRLLPANIAKITDGEIIYKAKDLLSMPEKELRSLRGNRIAMIFQEPMTSLNPVLTIGTQIEEVLKIHTKMNKKERIEKVENLLLSVGVPEPSKRRKSYPHELSGGLRQRAMIAMALACSPDILIADEPTTALDVTIQAQILDLLEELREKFKMSVLLITHDLGVIARQAHWISIMYAGKIVETGPADEIIENPLHPYTQGLYNSLPEEGASKHNGALKSIPGQVPAAGSIKAGCAFADRCPVATQECQNTSPEMIQISNKRYIRCPVTAEKIGGKTA